MMVFSDFTVRLIIISIIFYAIIIFLGQRYCIHLPNIFTNPLAMIIM